jgi:UDP-2,3-diacylglucosamine pyrophosphatase LpxH
MPTLFVVSDLHLGQTGLARMFHDQSQGMRLADLCSVVARTPDSELVLLGDIFDVTASLPPARGLGKFARALDLPLEERPAPPLSSICASIRENNPVALDALEALCDEATVTLVAGNHDRHLATPDGRAALDFAGLSAMRVETMAVRKAGERTVVLQHGHGWDPSNATPTGGGEVMTSIIHHAVVPFLRHQRPRSNVAIDPDRVIALRPEERVVPVLERWLKAGMFERFTDAFVEILVENGYMSRAVSWLATAERIRGRLKDDDDLWERAGHAALGALEGARNIPGKPPPPDILVLGHTHVIDWAVQEGRPGVERLYVNLGTWAARASDAAGPVEAILPVFRLDAPYRGKVIATLRDLSNQARLLQRFEVRA